MGSELRKAGRGVARLEQRLAGKGVEWLSRRPAARLAGCAFGPSWLLRARVSPVRIRQEPDRDGERVHLVAHLAGGARYRHRLGALEVRPGALVLIGGHEGCEVWHRDESSVVAWTVPLGTVAPFLPPRRRLGPVAVVDGALAEIAAAHAGQLARTGHALPEAAAAALVDHLGMLVGFAFSRRSGEPAAESHRALMRQRILALIEARHREPGLNAAAAARSLSMSRRWLNTLLQGSGRSFADRLSERRLDAAHALLRDPRGDGLSVTAIAFSSGFNDLSTFHRRFRARYGTTPGAVRAARPPRR